MQNPVIAACPSCKTQLMINNPYDPVRCTVCGEVFTALEKSQIAHTQAEDIFLSGSSFLALGQYEEAAMRFLEAAKLSPSEPKNWLYLLCAITVRFTVLHPIADESAALLIGNRRIIYQSVYKNLMSTAKKDDFIYAKSEFDIDLSPDGFELWSRILDEILSEGFPYPIKKAATLAHFATAKLERTHPEIAKQYYHALCKRLNPINDGVLEINTLRYYPDSPDGVLKIDAEADSIEFAEDNIEGAERFSAFVLTKGVESIGANFPFPELVVDKDVTEIPPKLMSFCLPLKKVTLSKSVKSIGKSAFSDCTSLRSVGPLDDVQGIGSRAFFGTAIRQLSLPDSLQRLGSEILGSKTATKEEIVKYIISLDASLAKSNTDFNLVNGFKCGYIERNNGKCRIVYPQNADGTALSHDEKMIFKALACVNIEKNEQTAPKKEGAMSKIRSVFGKFKKKS